MGLSTGLFVPGASFLESEVLRGKLASVLGKGYRGAY